MPPKKTDPSTPEAKAPTETDMKFIKSMMQNMRAKPDVDWDAVAAGMTLKGARCAKERFRQISIKYGWNTKSSSPRGQGEGDEGAATGPNTPASTRKVTKRTPVKKKTAKKQENFDRAKDEDNAENEHVEAVTEADGEEVGGENGN